VPDLTALYERVTRRNFTGRPVTSLENFTHPVEEDLVGPSSIDGFMIEGDATLQELDDPIVSIPTDQRTPSAADAAVAMQTAICYLVHKPTATAEDRRMLESLERKFNRLAILGRQAYLGGLE
jgi:hypothetical protein